MGWAEDIYKIGKDIIQNNRKDKGTIYLSRSQVNWDVFNARVKTKYWVAGTSLVRIVHRDLFKEFFTRKGISEIRIILPDTKEGTDSYRQLNLFNELGNGQLVYEQVKECSDAFSMLKQKIKKETTQYRSYLKKYPFSMYSNITLSDCEAYISFYNPTGVGDKNFTIYYDRKKNEQGYNAIEREFLMMWEKSK